MCFRHVGYLLPANYLTTYHDNACGCVSNLAFHCKRQR